MIVVGGKTRDSNEAHLSYSRFTKFNFLTSMVIFNQLNSVKCYEVQFSGRYNKLKGKVQEKYINYSRKINMNGYMEALQIVQFIIQCTLCEFEGKDQHISRGVYLFRYCDHVEKGIAIINSSSLNLKR